ncbi:MAG: GNAT family N-acetyltransferase, partial [Sulfuricaulis sp.]|nr:GNAT family N-acetyltransferase [Sulfuricaulis sp.]
MQTSTLSFLVTHDTDRPHPVAGREHLRQVSEAFYAYLLGRKREWSVLEFHQQDAASTLFPPPAAVDLKGYRVRQWPSLENGTIHVQWNTLRDYFKALPQKSRSNVSRQVRSLFAAGKVEFLSSSDPAVTPALFELYRRSESHSWKSQAQANIDRNPERVAYLKGLLDARQPMRLSIQLLLLDGIPIAGLIVGAYKQGLYALYMAYDERLSRLAPGSALMLMGMRQAIDGGYAFLNLLSGSGYYKTRWLAQITETRVGQIYRVGGLMYWHRLLGDWKRRLFSARSKEPPALFNPLRREVSVHDDEQTGSGKRTETPATSGEQQRIAALIAGVCKGQCEYLSAAQLAAVM